MRTKRVRVQRDPFPVTEIIFSDVVTVIGRHCPLYSLARMCTLNKACTIVWKVKSQDILTALPVWGVARDMLSRGLSTLSDVRRMRAVKAMIQAVRLDVKSEYRSLLLSLRKHPATPTEAHALMAQAYESLITPRAIAPSLHPYLHAVTRSDFESVVMDALASTVCTILRVTALQGPDTGLLNIVILHKTLEDAAGGYTQTTLMRTLLYNALGASAVGALLKQEKLFNTYISITGAAPSPSVTKGRNIIHRIVGVEGSASVSKLFTATELKLR